MSEGDGFLDFGLGLESCAKRLEGEHAERLGLKDRTLSFGVDFLDAALGGIFPNDLVLVGARTGAGKTEFATLVAMTNVLAGYRVDYFALEAEPREIERRLKYKLIIQAAKQYGLVNLAECSFFDWYMGRLETALGRFEAHADKTIAEQFSSLRTFYRARDFTVDDLEKKFLAIQDQTDLIILDHLHYVDTDDANENRGYKQIVKRLRDVVLNIGKPVLVVAHIRKADRRQSTLVPQLEDFHGTSDIPKICTKAIVLGPAHDRPQPVGDDGRSVTYLWPTYVQTPKCRFDGSRTRYIGALIYDARTGFYHPRFELGRTTDGAKFESVAREDLPRWAKELAVQPPSEDA